MHDQDKSKTDLIEELETLRKQVAERQALLDAVLEHAADGICVMDAEAGQLRLVNSGCCEETGLPREALLGGSGQNRQPGGEFLDSTGQRSLTENELPLFRAIRHGETIKDMELSFVRDGEKRRIVCDASPVRGGDGNIAYGVVSWRDVTAERAARETIRRALAEKEFLLREVHHRVKNNLQIISSLLNLQAAQLRDWAAVQAIRDSQTRVRSMALIHEKLYQGDLSPSIDFSAYIEDLFRAICEAYGLSRAMIRFVAKVEPIGLGLDQAVACGLILNELITNSVKHAFPQGRRGVIQVEARLAAGQAFMAVQDDGVGLPEDFLARRAFSLGMVLVDSLTSQLEGELTVTNAVGARFEISFPLAMPL